MLLNSKRHIDQRGAEVNIVKLTVKYLSTKVTENISDTFVYDCMKVCVNETFLKRYLNVSYRYWLLPRISNEKF